MVENNLVWAELPSLLPPLPLPGEVWMDGWRSFCLEFKKGIYANSTPNANAKKEGIYYYYMAYTAH